MVIALQRSEPSCFFADIAATPCHGRLRRAHLVPKRLLKQHGHERYVWDDRAWVWACGGAGFGNAGHHGEFDAARLRIPPERLPSDFRAMMEELAMTWWVEKMIDGPRRS